MGRSLPGDQRRPAADLAGVAGARAGHATPWSLLVSRCYR